MGLFTLCFDAVLAIGRDQILQAARKWWRAHGYRVSDVQHQTRLDITNRKLFKDRMIKGYAIVGTVHAIEQKDGRARVKVAYLAPSALPGEQPDWTLARRFDQFVVEVLDEHKAHDDISASRLLARIRTRRSEVSRLFMLGRTDAEIAAQLLVSVETIKGDRAALGLVQHRRKKDT